MLPDGPLFELKFIVGCKQSVLFSISTEKVLALAGKEWLSFYDLRTKGFSGEFTLQQILGDYTQFTNEQASQPRVSGRTSQVRLETHPAISCLEAGENTLLVGFCLVSVIVQFAVGDKPVINRTVKLRSSSFLRLNRIILDCDVSNALLICSHSETNEVSTCNDLQLGEPIRATTYSRKANVLITQLAMNIMNSQYALQPLRW